MAASTLSMMSLCPTFSTSLVWLATGSHPSASSLPAPPLGRASLICKHSLTCDDVLSGLKCKGATLKHRMSSSRQVCRASTMETRVSASAPAPSPIRVPLPDSGPLAPPDWVRKAVEEKPWRGGLEPCGEHSYAVGSEHIEGSLPAELQGTAYACGPGRVRIGAKKYGHWFDGDGMVYALLLAGGDVRFVSRWVRTPRFTAQEAAGDGDFAERCVWTPSGKGLLANLSLPANPSNTSAVVFADRVLALCEGGSPVEVDPATLQTRGPVHTEIQSAFSAHPKIDPSTGEMFNMGMGKRVDRPLSLNVFQLSPGGEVRQQRSLPLERLGFVHDMAMSKHYLTFVIPPYVIPFTGLLQYMVGLTPLGQKLRWEEERGTRVIILERETLTPVLDTHVDTFSTYHFCNSYEEDGHLHVLVNILDGPRESLEDCFKDMYASVWRRENHNTLWDMVWRTDTWQLVSKKPAMPPTTGSPGGHPLGMEFPHVHPDYVGRKNRFVYTVAKQSADSSAGNGPAGAAPQQEGSYFDCLQKLDLERNKVQTFKFPPGQYPSEPSFIPRAEGGGAEDAGYLLTFVYDAPSHTSKVFILDAADFEAAPVAIIHLSTHVPYYFHGCWAPGKGQPS
eukprot:jgi/Mesen1/4161/ME000219S03284